MSSGFKDELQQLN